MTFTSYLAEQLVDFVEVYKRYFKKTLYPCLLLAVCCLACMVPFQWISNAGSSQDGIPSPHWSLFQCLFYRFSTLNNYSLIDLTKITFIFFAGLFSLAISKFESEEQEPDKTKSSPVKLLFNSILPLCVFLLICVSADYGLSKLHGQFESKTDLFDKWMRGVIFQIRIYLPLILFSIIIYQQRTEEYPKMTFKKLGFLFVALWLFNEFTYETMIFVKAHIIGLILIPYGDKNTYIEESLLSLPLVAFWFLGFHSAMNNSLKIMDNQDIKIDAQYDEADSVENIEVSN